jgi:hypothetical protein
MAKTSLYVKGSFVNGSCEAAELGVFGDKPVSRRECFLW